MLLNKVRNMKLVCNANRNMCMLQVATHGDALTVVTSLCTYWM
jgi:hypothetical protein